MRFPTRLLAAHSYFALLLFAAYVVVVAVIAVGVDVFGTLNRSAWEAAVQLPRWYALFVGVALIREYLPLYLAHGQTRRQFGAQAAVTIALFAPFLSALITVGYLLETLLYGLAGRPQVIDRVHLFTEPTQVPLVFAEYLVEFVAWIVAGAFIAAGFYRWQGGGLLLIPVGVGLWILVEGAIGKELRLPFIGDRLSGLSADLPQSTGLALGVGLGVFVFGLAATWAIIRDVPLRNR
ncbi:hypothetical protein Ppa06_30480 [Planomonospora parontospora subsp. parontospora]|uniref:Uncharacterized protein n=2 Tax=Planomonospora parontospora TaxID=58119 RepID=A0AA37F569_9ACTN|nr:hypothetical protein [Planomonospora parontospora]GGK72214.1 hypothetical protein GCM10010126_34570 [Planomonospora parontospora]GII09250.1 hypothetical protein Ppa06_30480 [Planomonospora parontospora subsp. parontospora]